MSYTEANLMNDPVSLGIPELTRRKRGRPRGKAKLILTPENSQEIVRRVRIRLEGEKHSSNAIANHYGVSEAAIVSAIRRLRKKGML
jgi:DNA invertase Pin-like site-specific DNA recombinase